MEEAQEKEIAKTKKTMFYEKGWWYYNYWETLEPQGDEIGKLFEEVCRLCPDFYDFGLKQDMIETRDKSNKSFFIGEMNEDSQICCC